MFIDMKVILLASLSANGMIAQADGQRSTDWTSKEDFKFFVEKTKECGVIIMGRKTFETFGKPLKGRRLIVLSRGQVLNRRIDDKDGNGSVEWTQETPHELLARLEQEGCSKIVIGGGTSIYSQFLADDLVDELFLTIEPVLFGNGVSFVSGFDRINLQLKEVTKLGEQSILLHYAKLSVLAA